MVSPEGLAALASCLTATRQGAVIMIEPSGSPLARTTGTPLAAAHNVGLALADNLTTASHGLHLASLEPTPEDYLDALTRRVAKGDETGLRPVLDVMRWRVSKRPGDELEIKKADTEIAMAFTIITTSQRDICCQVSRLTIPKRRDWVLLSPGQRADRRARLLSLDAFARLPRYAAEIAVHDNTLLDRVVGTLWWSTGDLRIGGSW